MQVSSQIQGFKIQKNHRMQQEEVLSKVLLPKFPFTQVGKVAQRKKNNNEFWHQNLLWGCLCDSKLQKTKKFTKPFRRAGGTQAEKSAKIGLNGLCVSTAIFKMASWIFLFFAILNHINIPITDFEVRIRCYFFSSELPCQLGWTRRQVP